MVEQGWVEYRLPGALHGAGLAAAVRPLLGAGRTGLFLRSLSTAEPAVTVVLRPSGTPAPPAPPGWAGPAPARRSPLAGAFTGPALDEVSRDVLAAVTPALVELLEPGRGRSLLAGALDLTVAHLAAMADPGPPHRPGRPPGPGELPISFLSLHSHAEAFIASSTDPGRARAALARQYAANEQTIQTRVWQVLTEIRCDPATHEPHRVWHRVMRASRPVVAGLFRRGELALAPDEHDPAGTDRLAASAFHQAVGSSPRMQRFLQEDPEFLAVRLLTSLLYLSMHTAGHTLAERYFLCYAVSRACASIFGADPMRVLAQRA